MFQQKHVNASQMPALGVTGTEITRKLNAAVSSALAHLSNDLLGNMNDTHVHSTLQR